MLPPRWLMLVLTCVVALPAVSLAQGDPDPGGLEAWRRAIEEMKRTVILSAVPTTYTVAQWQPVILDIEWRPRPEIRDVINATNQMTSEIPLVAEYFETLDSRWFPLHYRMDRWRAAGPMKDQARRWNGLPLRTRRVILEDPGSQVLTRKPGTLRLRASYHWGGLITSRPLTITVLPHGTPEAVVKALDARCDPRRLRWAFEFVLTDAHPNETQRALAREAVRLAAGSQIEPFLRYWLAFEETTVYDWHEQRSIAAGSAGERALALLDGLVQGTRDRTVRESALYLAYLITRFAKERTGREATYLKALQKEFPNSYFLWEIDLGCVRKLTMSHQGCPHNPW